MDEKLAVSKVFHAINTKGMSGKAISDMVWLDGVPTIVLDWVTVGKVVDVPGTLVPLDPDGLEKIDPKYWGADWLYRAAINDPRG